ncbi:hypothetical protein LQZ19_19255 [Treponema primitia]|uniref:hypothetical protein n=1 Tax=Treponema primitia TaxID=88058 RepID=UPI00397FB8C4
MDSKRIYYLSLLLILYMFPAADMHTQELPADEGDYFIVWEDDGPMFMQRLSWDHDEFAFRYELILEEEQNGENVEILREITEENYKLISLHPGRYRYTVMVYNLLDKIEYTMDWVYFEVLRALQPKILAFTPGEIFLDGNTQLQQLAVNTEDLVPGALLMLRRLEPEQEIHPLRTEINGKTAQLIFNSGQLEPGSYNVYIRNPGGLDASRGILRVSFRGPPEQGIPEQGIPEEDVPEEDVPGQGIPETGKTYLGRPDISVSVGYSPLIPLYGALFSGDAFDKFLFPLGAAAQVNIVPLKWGWCNLGLEFGASLNKPEVQKENYDVAAKLLGAQISLLYQLWLPNRIMALNFRLGTGAGVIWDFYFDYHSGKGDSLDSQYLSLVAGVSFQWLIRGPFFIEAGVDFTHILSSDDRSEPGYLRPVLSVGWKF